jgi:OmcA/MtrC family decaheme c-type cytochrome
MNFTGALFTSLAAGACLLLSNISFADVDKPVNVATLSPKAWSTLTFKAQVLNVTVKGTPIVDFTVTDRIGHPIVGLGSTMKRTTDLLASYPNIAFTIAKLVPGTNGNPSKWVNYLVDSTPTVAIPKPTVGRFPGTDNVGKLVDNGDGSYRYTFYRDITKVKDVIAATVDTDKYMKTDLGDLSYDPNLTHRLGMQISGNAPGTGTNTPTGVQSIAGVPTKNPLNLTYDFVPSGGLPTFQHDVVQNAQCTQCHGQLNKIGFHGGSRYDTKYCVTCHTDQVKVGAIEATSTADGKGFAGVTDKIDNRSPGEFTIMIHKMHMGKKLTLTGYNWLNRAEGQFNKNGFPQSPANCATCHTNTTKKAAQATNWKTMPSRAACGSCHDGINWVTNKGPKVHEGGPSNDDSQCATCHEVADIAKSHGPSAIR